MRGIRIFIVFIACLIIGGLIGYVKVEKEIEVSEIYENIKGIFKEQEEIVIPDLSAEGIKIVSEDYDEDTYVLEIEEDFEDINEYITSDMLQYYELAVSALERESHQRKGKEIVRLIIGQGENIIEFELGYENYESIEKVLGEEFYKEHISERGWDLLNNMDSFWMSKSLIDSLNEDRKSRIVWDNMVER